MSLQKVDRTHKIVNLKLLVVGSNARAFLEHVHRATNPNPQPPAPSSVPTYDYLPLRLGNIRDYQTFIHLFGMSDPRIADVARGFYPQMDGVVVAESSDALDDALLPPPLKVPVVVYGSPALADEVRNAVGDAAVMVIAPDAQDPLMVTRAIAKPMLQALSK